MTASGKDCRPYEDKPPPPISRDELVAEVLSFYEFLVTMYLPEDALRRPPPTGWPGITPERLAFLQKDDTVIDILKHLPYIRMDDWPAEFHIYADCFGNDYSGQKFESGGVKYQDEGAVDPVPEALEDTGGRLPSHIFTLAQGTPADGYYILCNTQDGTMSLVNFIVGTEFETGARNFFRALKDEFRDLALIPFGVRSMGERIIAYRLDPEDYGPLRDIFRKHGWPSERYCKAECLTELEGIMENRRRISLQR